MPQPRVLVLRAPGTNCDAESAFAFEQAGGKAESLHVNRVLENPARLADFQILCFPGGFSYGDDIAAGRILGNQIQHHLADCLREFKSAGKLILGICNGFQILMRTNVLVEADPRLGAPATLMLNDSGRYEDRWVRLEAGGSKCVFLSGVERMYLPVAHAEGKFVARDANVLAEMDRAGQLVLRYAAQSGQSGADVPYPANPNGSMGNVAGVCDATGRVLGLMPHPERFIDPTQHPRWTRGEAGPVGDGLAIFKNAVAYFA
ncbi:MAG: phosphoribosylformylglycinamidine synthase I [Pirellulales bacterium]